VKKSFEIFQIIGKLENLAATGLKGYFFEAISAAGGGRKRCGSYWFRERAHRKDPEKKGGRVPL